jgi:hypothetical protein
MLLLDRAHSKSLYDVGFITLPYRSCAPAKPSVFMVMNGSAGQP